MVAVIWTWIWPWLIGLLFSLIGGHFATNAFLKVLRFWMVSAEQPQRPLLKEVPPWLTGIVERPLFTILVGASFEGFPTAMMAWLALKMATNWNHLAGAISMIFAFMGGAARNQLVGG